MIRTVLQLNITVLCVYDLNMAPAKRRAYEADFKLRAIRVENGNRAAARRFGINESMVRTWRKHEDDLKQVKSF